MRDDADPARAWDRIRRSQRPIGDLLLDQEVIAGVGNVYRAEVLFRHRMHPLRPGRTLRVGQWRALWEDLVVLMTDGVKTGTIDTVRPEHTPEAMGRPAREDDHGGEVYVYRRAGQAVPGLRHPDPHGDPQRKKPLLVWALSAAVQVPRRTVSATDPDGITSMSGAPKSRSGVPARVPDRISAAWKSLDEPGAPTKGPLLRSGGVLGHLRRRHHRLPASTCPSTCWSCR